MTRSESITSIENVFIPPERYLTERFVIRSYMPGDANLYCEAVNSSYEHLITFLPWACPRTSLNDAEKLARRFRAHYLLNQDYVLAILNIDETVWLGSSGFHLREGGLKSLSAEIGMWIRKDAAGQGLGTHLLCDLLTWGFSVWPWERLSWVCNLKNNASRRTAEKAGMVLEGQMRQFYREKDGLREDRLCFSALRSEWQDPRS